MKHYIFSAMIKLTVFGGKNYIVIYYYILYYIVKRLDTSRKRQFYYPISIGKF